MARPLKKERSYNYSKLLIAEEPRLYQYTVAKVLGIPKAIILQQIKYWLANTNDTNRMNIDKFGVTRKWIYKTAKDWEKEIPLDWTTIRDNLQDMERDYVIYDDNLNKELPYLYSEQFAKSVGNMQKYYALDETVLWTYMSRWIPLKKPEYLKELESAEKLLAIEKNKLPYDEEKIRDAKRLADSWKHRANTCKYVLTQEEIDLINYNAEKGKRMDEKRELAKAARASKNHEEEIMQSVEGEVVDETTPNDSFGIQEDASQNFF